MVASAESLTGRRFPATLDLRTNTKLFQYILLPQLGRCARLVRNGPQANQHEYCCHGLASELQGAPLSVADLLIGVFVRSYCFDEPGVHFVAGGMEIANQPLGIIGSVLTNVLHFLLSEQLGEQVGRVGVRRPLFGLIDHCLGLQ
jgi:hypothetical protein